MNRGLRHFAVLGVLSGLLYSPLLRAATGDTSIANLQVSGMVPVYFQVIANSINNFLDLTPKVVVTQRAIGMIHFKYNENVASITVSSSTVSGAPENASNVAYSFAAGGFKVSFRSGCQSVDTPYNTPFTLTNSGTDVKSTLSTSLTTFGIEEDCELDATYTGTSVNLPMAGFYNMNVVITMVSQ